MKRSIPKDFKASDGKNYWNCWTRNYRPSTDGYITHAFEEKSEQHRRMRALCGARYCDSGLQSVPHESTPGCIKCRRILIKRGVMTGDEYR